MDDHTDDHVQEHAPEPVARRAALRRLAMLGGAAAVGAAVLRPDPAGAAVGSMNYGTTNDAGTSLTTLTSSNGSYTLNILNSSFAEALVVNSNTGQCIFARQNGADASADAMYIQKNGTAGGVGLRVTSPSPAAGVSVSRSNASPDGATVDAVQVSRGPVVRARATSAGNAEPLFQGTHGGVGLGIDVSLNNAGNGSSAVKATTKGTGVALRGTVDNASSPAQAIRGDTNGTGYAIYGQTTGNRAALGGNGGSTARGAVLISNVAQLRLQPSTLATRPASGQAGDLFVDASKRLWFCKGGTAWVQLA